MNSHKEHEIRALFQESHQQPPIDFTESIMAGLPKAKPLPAYLKAPLMGRLQWAVVLVGALILLVLSLQVQGLPELGAMFRELKEYSPELPALQLPDLNYPGAFMASLAIVGMLGLYGIDRYLNSRKRLL